MKTLLLISASLVSLRAETVEGVITDTMCGAKHTMAKGMSDAECAKMCAKGSSDYALFDGKTVWTLSNQKLAAQFAAKRVAVSGDVNAAQRKIKVAQIKESN
jgi:fructose-specific component phosphotransferase system IIB-like protein